MVVLTNVPIRVYRKFQVNERGCWIWPGARRGGNQMSGCRSGAYGEASVDNVLQYTHHLTFKALYGSIPFGYVLDHVECDTPLCGNPWHLVPVTDLHNKRRQRRY